MKTLDRLFRGAASLLTLGSLLTTAPAQARSNPDGADPAPFVGLAHVAIRTADLAKSQTFYEKLGFEKAFSAEKNGAVTQAFYKINDREFLELYPRLGDDPTKEPIGFLHLCFDGKDLEALYTHYRNEGLQPTAVRKAGMGNLLFTLRGPEGQNIEYTQYMPESKHTLDRGQHLGPDRISNEMYGIALAMRDLPAAMTFYKEKLGFQPVPDRPDILLIPGSSQLLELFSSEAVDPRGQTFYSVSDLGKTANELKRRKVSFKRSRGEIKVLDPDGNLLLFRADHSMQ